MQCAERFSKCVDVDGFKPSQLTEMLSLPDAAETEKFIAEKAAEGKEIGKLVLLAEARLGEIFNRMPKATTNNPHGNNQFRSNSSREEIDLAEPDAGDKPISKCRNSTRLEIQRRIRRNA